MKSPESSLVLGALVAPQWCKHHTVATVPHINQPGGVFQASEHPSVIGRERELRRLADAVRRLAAATVAHAASPGDTEALAGEVEMLAGRLEAYVPDKPPPRFGPDAPDFDGPPMTHLRAPFDLVTGIYNPLAVPVEMEVDDAVDPPVSRGRVVFTTGYEGPPGCAHGAAIAASFDMVLTSACASMEVSGPTMLLSVRYRRPTLLNTETVFEGWVDRLEGNRTHTKGRTWQDGEITAEAEGMFRQLDRDEIYRLSQRSPG